MRNDLNIAILSSLIFAFGLSDAFAQAQCPAGLTYLGQAYKEASAVNGEAKVQAVPVLVQFPRNIAIDRSYRQTGGQWAGGSASAVMSDGDVPNGLHIIATGTTGGEKGWSVHKPEMKVLEEDENGRIVQRGYIMALYCHTGSGAGAMLGYVSCNVRADVCAKLKTSEFTPPLFSR